MSELIKSRSLLLEQLETRSLLAGGVFSFAADHHDDHVDRQRRDRHQDNHPMDRPADIQSLGRVQDRRTAQDIRSSHERFKDRPPILQIPSFTIEQRVASILAPIEGFRPSPNRGSISVSPTTDPPLDRLQGSKAASASPLPVRLESIPTDISTSFEEQSLTSIRTTQPDSSQHESAPTASVEEIEKTTAPLRAISLSTTVASNRVTSNRVASNGDATGSEAWRITEFEISWDSAIRSLFQTHDRVAKAHSLVGPDTIEWSRSTSGMVESFPLLGVAPQSKPESASEVPWELKRETLRGLRDVTQTQPEQARSEQLDPTDKVIASWFTGPSGFVSLESQGGPMLSADIHAGIVDIVLNATLGLHRRLDLVADNAPAPTDEVIRDAILAAIAGEQSSTAVPVQDAPPQASSQDRLSGLAYPGAAVVATALVLAKRQREANALLATHQTSPSE